ncbi:ataxin-2 homolog [Diaphorina citri]|uniref:Ataxin-2 homolog n=1 Tax=Diaphorina citri TaxID=121845 RepID=A0A3Q0IZI5_DIACI|nr:ataxin-2 homolog [Diaphorina citri]
MDTHKQRLERELQKQNQKLNNNLKALSVKNNNESNINNNSKKGKKKQQQQQQQAKQQQQQKTQESNSASSSKKNKKKNKNKGGEDGSQSQQSASPGLPDEGDVPKMVTIKRVMETSGTEPTVTITLRGATPNEDKVLYTLQNGHVCPIEEKNRQAAAAAASAGKKSKNSRNAKPTPSAQSQPGKRLTTATHVQHTPGVLEINVNGGGKPAPANKNGKGGAGSQAGSNATAAGLKKSGSTGTVTVRAGSVGVELGQNGYLPSARLPSSTGGQAGFSSMSVVNMKATPAPSVAVRKSPLVTPSPGSAGSIPAPPPQLTTSTAIQISNAISSLTSNGGGDFNIEDLRLPPGITITKVVPPYPSLHMNGVHEENSAASSLSCDGGDSDNLNKGKLVLVYVGPSAIINAVCHYDMI